MHKKTIISVAMSTFVSVLAIAGITYAATPASSDTSLLNKGTVEVDSLKVGKQGTGGVTFFNGTIINNTTNSGADNPVTFGDNVRIDGTIFRGTTAGPSGGVGPVKVNDDIEVEGTTNLKGATTSLGITATGDISATNITGSGIVSGTSLSTTGAITGANLTTTGNMNIGGTTTLTGATTTGSIASTGNISQGITNEGVVKGWAHVSADGSLIKGYNTTSSLKQATGTYNVTFNFDPTDRVFSVSPSGSSDDTVAVRFLGAVNSAIDNTVRVRSRDDAGTLSDGVFMLIVY